MFFIEKKLILLNNPRCASHTTENSIINSSLSYQYLHSMGESYNNGYAICESTNILDFKRLNKQYEHLHVALIDMYKNFGRHQSVGITRDYTDRFLSSLKFLYKYYEINGFEMVVTPEEVDNEFVKKTITKDFINLLEMGLDDNGDLLKGRFIKNNNNYTNLSSFSRTLMIINSNKWLTSGEKVTYEFDINELYKFKNFIENEFDKEIIISSERLNNSDSIKFPNLILNQDLRDYIWNTIEKKYHNKKLF